MLCTNMCRCSVAIDGADQIKLCCFVICHDVNNNEGSFHDVHVYIFHFIDIVVLSRVYNEDV